MLQNLERYQIIKPSEVTKISTALSLLAPLSLEKLEYHGIPNHSSLTHHKSAWGRIQSRILMMWQYHTIPASFHVWWEGSYDPKQIKALLASWQCHHKNKKTVWIPYLSYLNPRTCTRSLSVPTRPNVGNAWRSHLWRQDMTEVRKNDNGRRSWSFISIKGDMTLTPVAPLLQPQDPFWNIASARSWKTSKHESV